MKSLRKNVGRKQIEDGRKMRSIEKSNKQDNEEFSKLNYHCDLCDCLIKKCNRVRHEQTAKRIRNVDVKGE